MRLRDFAPEALVSYLRTVKAKLRYSHAEVWSDRIHPTASVGAGCLISCGVEIGPLVRIADNSYVNKGSIIASGSVGKFCSIGYYCQIGLPEHPLEFVSTSPKTYGRRNVFGKPCIWNDYECPPQIGNDVWVGSGAIILQGVHIGDGAVIAAGAVVTRSVAPYEIVIGVPAHAVRKRFDEDCICELLRLQWWNLPPNELMEYAHLFGTWNWRAGVYPNIAREGH